MAGIFIVGFCGILYSVIRSSYCCNILWKQALLPSQDGYQLSYIQGTIALLRTDDHMNFGVKLIDALFITRPVVLVTVWGFSVLGYCRCFFYYRSVPLSSLWQSAHFSSFFWMIVFSFSVAAVFVFNQIADYEVDRENDGFPLLINTGFSKQDAFLIASVFWGLSIAIIFFWGDPRLVYFSLLAGILGIVYSFRPFYFSGRPLADFLSNALGYGVVAFGVGWILALPNNQLVFEDYLINCFPYFLLMCSGSISSTLSDIPGDKECGKITTAVYLGDHRAHLLATLLLAGAGVSAFFVKDLFVLIITAISLPLSIYYFFVKTRAVTEATYKVNGGLMMAAAGVLFPVFGLSGITIFIATRLYFSIRHKVRYPSLLPADSINE
ncbi:MAG: hypothetical protein GF401_01480 [Chitinivibrionales bacterium]|nr:hypothetical protein [Chitinivibrionales bacterium]